MNQCMTITVKLLLASCTQSSPLELIAGSQRDFRSLQGMRAPGYMCKLSIPFLAVHEN
ncbi:hypothetical protein KC19_VG103900 [Ceratodon purpureus]|uniref:Uncharacterized protein n=1 Tax=Ceratodon purpureus TaxID=3225 RepID=A0A8T0HNP1_CERPU|nr:hypothetical protein KC19_VG103900 [Ceratodon purpureus]